jgi:hypothetical protein
VFGQPDSLTAGFTARRQGARSHRAYLAVAAVTVGALTLVVMALGAAPAQAHIPIVGKIPVVGPVVEGIGSAGEAVLHPAETILKGFVDLLQAIFGGFEAHLITEVIAGLLAIPNFDTGHVAALEQTTTAIAAGMLTAVLTLSILRYYIAGLTNSSSGGFEALQGLVRVVGAVGFIILWPDFFSECLQIPSAFNHALLGSTSVQHNVAALFDAAMALGSGAFALNIGLGLIFVILIGLISAIVFVGLLWMKVLLSVMMMFLYVSMPLCIVLWPVPELSWLASSAMKALGVGVIVPSVWAILFALSAAVNTDVLTFAGSHSIIDTVIIRPLAGITLMLLCITIPRFLMRAALIGPHGQPGGWRVWRTVTFGMFAARAGAGGARSLATAAGEGHATAGRVIDALPTQIKPPTEAGSGSLAGRMVFGKSGYTKDDENDSERVPPPNVPAPDRGGGGGASSAATSGGAVAGAAAAGAATGGAGAPAGAAAGATASEGAASGAAGAAASESAAAGQPGASGAEAGAGAQREQPVSPSQQQQGQAQAGGRQAKWEEADRAGRGMYEQAHSQSESSSANDVRAAMAQLPPQTQQRLADIMDSSPDRLRDSIAHSMGDPGWSASERQALRTIGAARKKQAQDGMGLALGGQGTGGGGSPGGPGSPDATAPPPGTPSLGAPLREQPPTADQQASEPQQDASDINPFRE